MNKKLLGNRVLIEVDGGESKTEGGLIVTWNATDPGDMRVGKVVAVGTGKDTEHGHVDIHVGIGDTVMFQYGNDILVEGKEYQLVTGEDVIMIMEKSESGIPF